MKKKVFPIVGTLLFPLVITSCGENEQIMNNQPEFLREIVMTTQDFEPENDSRTLFQITDNVTQSTWAANDTVGVFPNEGAQAYFPMISGAGTKNATFTGGGWALKNASTYSAYYPFIGDIYLDRKAVPVNFEGQTQTKDASTDHLGAYDYMVATPSAPQDGLANFMFKHIGALVQLKLTVLEPATLESVTFITENEAFTIAGKVDVTTSDAQITAVNSSKEIKLNLQEVSTTESNQVVTLYLMLPPTNLNDQPLKVRVNTIDDFGEITLDSKNFQAGRVYTLSATLEELTPRNGTYENDIVNIRVAGTMKDILGDNYSSITSLKVIGSINGDDIKLIRNMASSSGKLTDLDLSEANIVEDENFDSRSNGTVQSVIGEGMFSEATKLTNIKLPNNTSVIGKKAFYNCSNLQVITIPNEVISINDYAFHGCSNLMSVNMNNKLISLGNYAFQYCYSLSNITLPNTLTSIGEGAFIRCWNLKKMSIPDGVTTISADAFFDCYSLTDLIIGNNVTSIGDDAFNGCSKLKEITIPDDVTSIGGSAFNGCKSLINITIPDNVTSIGGSAFASCSSLESITLGKSVSSIGAYAFYYCNSLLRVDIPNGVTLIDDHTFDQCHKLVWVTLPESVTAIGKNVFHGCLKLEEITIPSKVTSIDEYAFYGCQSLKKINIPNGVTSISDDTFGGCSSLTNITLPDGLTSIGSRAFSSCTSLNDLSIPNGVTAIGTYAFSSCSFTNITIPNGVTAIGDGTFKSCKSLKSITIPSGVTSIGKEALYDCSALTSIIIPDGVTVIEEWTFRGCSSLTTITIPKDVYLIGEYAFYLCKSLSEVICKATTPPVLDKATFKDIASPATLYIPSGCSEAYNDNTRDWITYFSSIMENK